MVILFSSSSFSDPFALQTIFLITFPSFFHLKDTDLNSHPTLALDPAPTPVHSVPVKGPGGVQFVIGVDPGLFHFSPLKEITSFSPSQKNKAQMNPDLFSLFFLNYYYTFLLC